MNVPSSPAEDIGVLGDNIWFEGVLVVGDCYIVGIGIGDLHWMVDVPGLDMKEQGSLVGGIGVWGDGKGVEVGGKEVVGGVDGMEVGVVGDGKGVYDVGGIGVGDRV